ncbi:MAG: hypothetical protein LAT81_13790 [Oceanicaulis sp.]|nr:hypothetical protein [Oceanicaulis sp.]
MNTELKNIIQSEDLRDLSIDLVDKVIDNKVGSEIITEIPVLKYLVSIRRIHQSISDSIFIKKAMKVILEIGNVNWKERIELVNELSDEHSGGAEKIMLAIDKLESYEKCQVFGRLCRLKALNKIDTDGFMRLSRIIQNSYLHDLFSINSFVIGGKREIWEGDYHNIISMGLIFQEPSEQQKIEINHHRYDPEEPEVTGGQITFNYLLSYEGELLLKFYIDLFPEETEMVNKWRKKHKNV